MAEFWRTEVLFGTSDDLFYFGLGVDHIETGAGGGAWEDRYTSGLLKRLLRRRSSDGRLQARDREDCRRYLEGPLSGSISNVILDVDSNATI